MGTNNKWVTFGYRRKSKSGKTFIWNVKSGGTLLGTIGWYAHWRGYVFYPEGGTLYEQICLRAIADFCEIQTKKHCQVQRNKKDAK